MVLAQEESFSIEEVSVAGYEKVYKVTNKHVGLNAIICIHSTAMGPSLGGTRIYPYSSYEAAMSDVMRLARGMTYKSLLSETGWGGAKSVIICDPKRGKTREMLQAFGLAVNSLGGEYICAEDVGSTPEDMALISQVNPYVVGLPYEDSSGNPSPFTAWGTFRGIQSALHKLYGSDSLENRVVAVQGLGSVGWELVHFLFWHGAKLVVTDIDAEKCHKVAKATGAQVVSPEEILYVPCDVLAPCAMGGVISEKTIPRLRCRAIAGSANNQLMKDSDAEELFARNILYAPDFVINAGGLINVSSELDPQGYNPFAARRRVDQIYDKLVLIYNIAQQNRCSTQKACMMLADYRLKYGVGKRVEPPCFHHALQKKT